MIKKKSVNNIKANDSYQPRVSLIVPTYNEAIVIASKLQNIQEIDYPPEKLQVILIDSNSDDGTFAICKDFVAKNKMRFSVTLLSEQKRLGKSHALNTALQQADGEIIATSDADSFWENKALRKAVSYFADPCIGALTGRENLTNVKETVHTMSEGLYRRFYYTLRLGESNIHSTLIFQGELSLYRRSAFKTFEDKPGYSDDIGTVINIASNGYRCIYAPDIAFCDTAALSLNGRLTLKSRRAEHLIAGIIRSFKLKLQRKLPVPMSVVFFNFYLHIILPILLFVTLATTAIFYVLNFQYVWFLGFVFLIFLLRKPRVFAVSFLTSNIALIMGLLPNLTRKRRTATWQKIDEMRYKN